MAIIYARLTNSYKFKYQTVFLAKFDEQDEDGMLIDDVDLFNNIRTNNNLTQTDTNNIIIEWDLEEQLRDQESKVSGWRLDKTNSMIISFYKTREINGSSYVKIPLEFSAILNIQNDDNLCFYGQN